MALNCGCMLIIISIICGFDKASFICCAKLGSSSRLVISSADGGWARDSRLGRPAKPAYLAPVKPARGSFPVPEAKFWGTPAGGADEFAPVEEGVDWEAGFCLW